MPKARTVRRKRAPKATRKPRRRRRKKPKKVKKKIRPKKEKVQKKIREVGLPKEVLKLLPLTPPRGFKLMFGPAGRPVVYKGDVEDAPAFIREELCLDAFEVQQVRQITLNEERSRVLGDNAAKHNIVLSVHAPYAVNLLSESKDKIEASINRLIMTARIANWCGAGIVVFHPGYYGKVSPDSAVGLVLENLAPVVDAIRSEKMNVYLGPETMGKKSQFGALDELIEVAKEYPEVRIVFDVAHIHAREGGSLMTYESYDRLFGRVESELGSRYIRRLHIHFTEVEYGEKGEIRHLVLGSGTGPALDPLLEWLIENDVEAVIISESPILEADAIKMKHRAIELFRRKH